MHAAVMGQRVFLSMILGMSSVAFSMQLYTRAPRKMAETDQWLAKDPEKAVALAENTWVSFRDRVVSLKPKKSCCCWRSSLPSSDTLIEEHEARCSYFGIPIPRTRLSWHSNPDALHMFTTQVADSMVSMAQVVKNRPLSVYALGVGQFDNLVIFAKVRERCPALCVNFYFSDPEMHDDLALVDVRGQTAIAQQFYRWLQNHYSQTPGMNFENKDTWDEQGIAAITARDIDVVYALDDESSGGIVGRSFVALCENAERDKNHQFAGLMMCATLHGVAYVPYGVCAQPSKKNSD